MNSLLPASRQIGRPIAKDPNEGYRQEPLLPQGTTARRGRLSRIAILRHPIYRGKSKAIGRKAVSPLGLYSAGSAIMGATALKHL